MFKNPKVRSSVSIVDFHGNVLRANIPIPDLNRITRNDIKPEPTDAEWRFFYANMEVTTDEALQKVLQIQSCAVDDIQQKSESGVKLPSPAIGIRKDCFKQ